MSVSLRRVALALITIERIPIDDKRSAFRHSGSPPRSAEDPRLSPGFSALHFLRAREFAEDAAPSTNSHAPWRCDENSFPSCLAASHVSGRVVYTGRYERSSSHDFRGGLVM